jgi:acetyl-CoA carboxylase carboxyltransferase component
MATDGKDGIKLHAGPVEELRSRRQKALEMGGEDRVARHHNSGRLHARERIELLIDPGTWTEIGLLAEPEIKREQPMAADAVITGLARVSGRKVCVLAIDATVLAGTTAPVNMRKQNRIAEWAGRRGLPLICLSDNDGGRLPDLLGWRFSSVPFDFTSFLQSPAGFAEVPRVTAILGESYGDAALHAAMASYVVMRKNTAIALSGPPVIRAAIGEDVDAVELGGPAVSAEANGSAHAVVDDEEEAIVAVKRFLGYLPDSAALPAPVGPPAPPDRDPTAIADLVPSAPRRGYDMLRVIDSLVDGGSAMAWGDRYGKSLITCLARFDGEPVGLIASQPIQRAGVLDVPALRKEARFIDLCDTFNLPLVFLQDIPGLMIGTDAERAGILRAYEEVVSRLSRAEVPKIAVIVRKAYGGGHIALGGRPVKPDLLLAWPNAELGFMAPQTGVRTVHRRRLEQVRLEHGDEAYEELLGGLVEEWAAESQPWEAAANVILDDIIEPAETRDRIIGGIDFAWGSRRRVTRAGCDL